MNTPQTHAPDNVGSFAESKVIEALREIGYEVRTIDQADADLIAQLDGKSCAISVQARHFRKGSIESKMLVIEEARLDRLCTYASQSRLIPMIACVVCLSDEERLHLFLASVEHVRTHFKKVKFGYSLYFSEARIRQHIDDRDVLHKCWHDANLERFAKRANQIKD